MPRSYVNAREMLSDAKFYESYSRYDKDRGRYENWNEAVSRVMNMHAEKFKDVPGISPYLSEVEQMYLAKYILGAQRTLQFGGSQILQHNMRLYNCTSTYADRPAFFGEFFYVLLCGAGAGVSVQTHHVAKLPRIQARTKAAKVHVVEDSIEGWATALDVLMSSFLESGGKHPEYKGRKVYFDLNSIRPKGAMISGGFLAPGPEPLRRSLDRIEYLLTGLVIQEKGPATLRPIHVYDICMHVADAVLSGGVRRAATIFLFSPDDNEMATAKTGNWYVENPQRARSNNSALLVRNFTTFEQFEKLMKMTQEFGEPGFVWADSTEITFNPCVEIGMYPQIDGVSGWQGCNLTEINGGALLDKLDFYAACRAAAILGTLQAAYTDFKFLGEESKKIFDREALLGVSITGWMNNPELLFDPATLQRGAEIVLETNKEVAKLLGINPCARATCVKPSGSASVLLMTTSGIHGEHAPMYLRNMQMNKDTDVARVMYDTNPEMLEESVWSVGKTDWVASFPVIAPEGSLFNDQLLGIELLEKVKLAQKYWVEAGTNKELCAIEGVRHNVSNTIVVDDWEKVTNYIYENRDFFAGISFLPMSGDRDYAQAPFTRIYTAEEISERYGAGALFASGLIVTGLEAFDHLWNATQTAKWGAVGLDIESHDNTLKKDWIRRFKKFADNYFDGDLEKTEMLLKDVFLLHKWERIQQTMKPISWNEQLTTQRFTEIDTTGAAACVGQNPEGCLI